MIRIFVIHVVVICILTIFGSLLLSLPLLFLFFLFFDWSLIILYIYSVGYLVFPNEITPYRNTIAESIFFWLFRSVCFWQFTEVDSSYYNRFVSFFHIYLSLALFQQMSIDVFALGNTIMSNGKKYSYVRILYFYTFLCCLLYNSHTIVILVVYYSTSEYRQRENRNTIIEKHICVISHSSFVEIGILHSNRNMRLK